MTNPKWFRLPNAWIHAHRLKSFVGGSSLGQSMAALKILMAILLKAENKAAGLAGPTQGSAALTYDDLMELADLSRSMVAKGVKRLQEFGLVDVTSEGRGGKNRYKFVDYSAASWSKIPYRQIAGVGSPMRVDFLHDLSCRRSTDLNALKLYFLLCAHRSGANPYAMIGYNRITEASGIFNPRIRQAISILIEHGLIKVEQEKAGKQNSPNRYHILGS